MTSIFVTHDQTEANALADRIAVMEGGVLQQCNASQKELKDRPANLFVATFIGEPPMNVFEADVTHGGDDPLRRRARGGPALEFRALGSVPQSVHAAGDWPAGEGGKGNRHPPPRRPPRLGAEPGAGGVEPVDFGDQSHLALDVAD